MNYFEAVHAERVLKTFRRLVLEYWAARDEPPSPDKSLRQRVAEMVNPARQAANDVGSPTSISYREPLMVGGATFNLNVFELVLDESRKQFTIGTSDIISYLDRAVGAAAEAKRKALYRLILPWYWIIDIPALLLRIPFLILRKAGLPASIEQTAWAYLVKVLILIGAAVYLAGKGLDVSLTDLLTLFGK